MAQGADQRRLIDAEHAEHVVHVGWEPRALSEEVEDAELARDPRVLELKLGIEIDYPVVPPQLAAIDHDGQGRREKGLGGRTDLEDRACIDRNATRLAAHAEALGVYQRVTS